MNRLSYFKTLLLLCAGWLSSSSLFGQCEVQLVAGQQSSGCAPFTVKVRVANTSGKTASTYKWDYGDGNTNPTPKADSSLSISYLVGSPDTAKNFVPKCTITFTDGTTCTSTAAFIIKVWDNPKAKINVPVDATQCFKANKYCFTQSSKTGKNTNSKLIFYTWELGDGTLDSGDASGSPLHGCHNYQGPGTYQIKLTVTDAKGCHSTDIVPAKIKVLPDLVPIIAVTQKQKCGYTDGTFKNNIPDTTGWHVLSFAWNFGDSSALDTKDWGKTAFKHHYKDTGTFYPTFTINTKEGCHETTPIGAYPIVVVSAKISLHYKDSICWSEASGTGVTFIPKHISGVLGARWVFCTDDNVPGCDTRYLPDLANQTWKFQSGPKNYQVKLTVIHAVCDTIDTCFIVHVKGPGATININLPPPYETYRGPRVLNYTFIDKNGVRLPQYAQNPFSLQPFYDVLDTLHKVSCNRTISYQSFDKIFPPNSTTVYGYCDAKDTLSIDTTSDTLCLKLDKKKLPKHVVLGWGQILHGVVTGLTLKPTSTSTVYVDSSGTIPITFSVDSAVKYFSKTVNGKANPFYRKNPPPSAYLPGQRKSFIVDSFMARMGSFNAKTNDYDIPISKYNSVVSESYSNDSALAFHPGAPIDSFNHPVSSKFSDAAYRARRLNPKIAPTPFNTITMTPLLWLPESGKLFPNDMHDSDLWSCEAERLVRFTNNSAKFRLIPHTDDASMGVNQDTCRFTDKYLKDMRRATGDSMIKKDYPYYGRDNYPYSSDSLSYYWDFGDGYSGPLPDTAYYSFHDARDSMEFSREAAPWHYYKPINQVGRSCYSVSLKVKDLKMGCESSASQILLVNKPYASWDHSCYCKMNIYIQLAKGRQDLTVCMRGFKLVPPSDGAACAAKADGGAVPYKLNFKETLPGNCDDPENYWVVFDSALAIKYSRALAQDSMYYRFGWHYPPLPPNALTRDRNGPATGPINGITCFNNGRVLKNGDYLFDTLWDYQWLPKAVINLPFPTSPSYWWGTNPFPPDAYPGYVVGGQWFYPTTDSLCKTVGVIIQNGDCYDTVWYHNYICFNKQVADINFGNNVSTGGSGLGIPLKVPSTLGDIFHNFTTPFDTITFEGHKYDSLMEPVLGAWQASSAGGSWAWYPSQIRPALPHPLPGWVETPTRATYPDAPSGYSPAATIRIKTKQFGQPNITNFKLFIERLAFPDNGDYYYNDTFKIWPDRANLSTDWSDMDSVNKPSDTIYRAKAPTSPYTDKDTLTPGAIWFNIRDYVSKPNLNNNFFINALGTSLYIKKSEYDQLKNGKNVKVFRTDPRFPSLDIACDTFAKITIRAYQPGKTKWKDTIYVLNLADTTSADITNRKKPHSVMKFRMPYPGIYKITSVIRDIYDCQNGKYYYIINSHYAKFGSIDSVACVNKPVHFNQVVRYFTTDFDLTPTIDPPFLADGTPNPRVFDQPYLHKEAWVWDRVVSPNTGLFDSVTPYIVTLPAFTPWETPAIGKPGSPSYLPGPVVARQALWKNWPMAYVKYDSTKQEKIWWDMDVEGNLIKYKGKGHIDAVGPNPTWTYPKPGIYTVCMITRDSTGHLLKTYRRNLIKIIDVKSNFVVAPRPPAKTPDTLEFCSPHLYYFLDSSDISKGVNTYHYPKPKPWIFAYKDSVILPPDATHKTAYIGEKVIDYDSIIRWTWNLGDKSQSVLKTTHLDSFKRVYTYNDTFTISLKVHTAFSCEDSIKRKNYIYQVGPKPRFKIVGINKGCVPLTVRVQNLDRSGDSTTYVWNQHDGRVFSTDSSKEFVDMIYTHLKQADLDSLKDSSVYYITLTKIGKVFDILSHDYTKCSQTWPDTANPTDTVYQVVVYRRDSIGIKGDTSVCPHQVTTFHRTTKNPGIFVKYTWSAKEGMPSTGSDTIFTTQFATKGKKYITLTGTFKSHFNSSTRKVETCDSVVFRDSINVEDVKASFDIDSATAGALGKFYFKNTSSGGSKYFWTYDETADSNNHDLGHVDETVTTLDPARYHDYLQGTTLDNDNAHDKKDFSYKIRLIAQSPVGCRDTVFKTITFHRDFATWNVITPNGDNENDVFDPKVEGETFYHLMIFNRWGEKVFETTNKDDKWNGQNRNTGGDCAAGTYYYIVKYDLIGKVKGIGSKTGTITVIR